MPPLSNEVRRTVIVLKEKGLLIKDIKKRVKEQDVFISRAAIFKLLREYRHHGIVEDLARARPPKKLSADQLLSMTHSRTTMS